ncbi:MAG: hypothetical protein D6824_00050 [Planctomycetota bacterium]|nr:MAG: hypothetical protein D6824_00050 [Planctomycetota bacterium]
MNQSDKDSLLKAVEAVVKMRRKLEAPPDDGASLRHRLVFSFLLWNATTTHALRGLAKLEKTFVDINDLRIAMIDEIVDTLGKRYPLVQERAMRMRAALNDVFRREHSVDLERLRDLPKREARAWLDSLDGAPQYVAARVALLGLGAHSVPVDDRLAALLCKRCRLSRTPDPEALGAFLEKRIRAADAPVAHSALQAWSDASRTPRITVRDPARAL